MLRDFTTEVTGWFFLSGALMLWGGWVLLPRRAGMFFRSDDFPAIGARLKLWLWLYRVHFTRWPWGKGRLFRLVCVWCRSGRCYRSAWSPIAARQRAFLPPSQRINASKRVQCSYPSQGGRQLLAALGLGGRKLPSCLLRKSSSFARFALRCWLAAMA